MNKSPAFQFYPKDFLGDIHVKDMTLAELGAYITLLCHCWTEDGLPTDSRVVVRWFKQYPSVAKCFYEKDGVYRHSRLDQELSKQHEWREKSRIGGLHSAETKRTVKGGSRVVQPKVNSSSSLSSLHSSSTDNMKNNKNYSSCPKYEPSDVDIRLTQLLIDLMQKNNPESSTLKHLTEKKQMDWMNQCRLLRETDNRTEADIERVIRFSQGDSFWQKNILSMPKLREKWDQLWMKAGRTDGWDQDAWVKSMEKRLEEKKNGTI